ncbi:uncharacterized protein LOC135495058 [Lineus longissimus]|uniref:uncharacterized protein LOC135495058 n=1 Tax=Lineus longissimus TaxID=88925 RepID=UPI00315D6945
MEASTVFEDGHYQMNLPFRDQVVTMPNNRAQAEQRAIHLKRKLCNYTRLLSDYKTFMNELLHKGNAEEVKDEDLEGSSGRVWYIPHHGIYHPKKPNKLRVVFDCAARFSGTSLNDKLLQGPDLTNSLVGVLLRFRQERTALAADIEKMFYQVKVTPIQRDYLRYFWWPDGNLDQEPKVYRMAVHLFGATSSPSCANFALWRTAEDNTDFPEGIRRSHRKSFYVDDYLQSPADETSTKDKTKGDVKQAMDLCAKGGFRLTAWSSNSREVLESIPEELRAKDLKGINLDQDMLPAERVLGVEWTIESDTFGFNIQIREKPPTTRGILSITSSINDPLGFAAPFILLGKMLLQRLCKLNLGWDDEIPERDRKEWEEWLADLPQLAEFQVERCIKPEDFGPIKDAKIHHFSDASESGYGTASYIRLVDDKGKIHCAFLMGKARVAPLKQNTIPRLELTAATVSARVDSLLKEELDLSTTDSIFWTDSMSVIKYIRNTTSRFQTFVANRIAMIHWRSEPHQWRYVDTNSNPADDASRGLPAKWASIRRSTDG